MRTSPPTAQQMRSVVALPDEMQQMRTVLQGIDVKNPTVPVAEAIALTTVDARHIAGRLQKLFVRAQISALDAKTLLVRADPQDLPQIKALVPPLADATTGQASRIGRLQAFTRLSVSRCG